MVDNKSLENIHNVIKNNVIKNVNNDVFFLILKKYLVNYRRNIDDVFLT